MNRLIPILIAAFFVTGGVANAATNQNQASSDKDKSAVSGNMTEEDVSVQPDKKPAANEKSAERDGVSVMNQVVQARSDLFNKKYDAAKNDLKRAEALLTKVSSEEPGVIVKERIKTARNKLDYENTEHVINDFVPIYSDLQEMEAYQPQTNARNHLDKAKSAIKSGNKNLGQKELDLASDSITFTQVSLPVDEAQRDIKEAQSLLIKKNYKDADKPLQRLEDNLLISVNNVTAVDKPVLGKGEKQGSSGGSTSSKP